MRIIGNDVRVYNCKLVLIHFTLQLSESVRFISPLVQIAITWLSI